MTQFNTKTRLTRWLTSAGVVPVFLIIGLFMIVSATTPRYGSTGAHQFENGQITNKDALVARYERPVGRFLKQPSRFPHDD